MEPVTLEMLKQLLDSIMEDVKDEPMWVDDVVSIEFEQYHWTDVDTIENAVHILVSAGLLNLVHLGRGALVTIPK